MRTIYKYAIGPAIEMPIGAQILTVQPQRETPVVWAIVNPHAADKEIRTFYVVGTGHQIDEEAIAECSQYVGTFQLAGGSLVFHAFVSPGGR